MKHSYVLVFMLLLFVVTLVQAQIYEDLFEEGFETTWPTPGWLMSGVARVSATTTTDPAVEVTEPFEGTYCAGMSSAPSNYLVSPLKNNPGAYYMFVHKKDTGNYQFIVEFQVEDNVSAGADLTGTWAQVGEYWASQGWWEPLTINLTGYAAGYVRIRPTPPPPTPLKYMYFDRYNDGTVPVELSSFTAAVVQQPDQQYLVELHWTTQSETLAAGFNVFRNSTTDAGTATQINLAMMPATNTSNQSDYMFTDDETEPGTWFYWLQSNDISGQIQLFGPISAKVNGGPGTDDTPQFNIATKLQDAYPNPFNPKTTIPFTLISKASVKLEIFNQKGQLIWAYANANADPGLYHVNWDGRDLSGREVSSGVYLCRMVSNEYQGIKKLVLQK